MQNQPITSNNKANTTANQNVNQANKPETNTIANEARSESNTDTLTERITIKNEICHGKPTICGLRYSVKMVLELLSSGMTTDEILADYEDLERKDIFASFAFATQLTQVKQVELAAI